MTHTFHMTATKQYIIAQIQACGAKAVLDNFDGTDEEAIAALRADPHTHFPIGDCDNQDESGRCLGHDRE